MKSKQQQPTLLLKITGLGGLHPNCAVLQNANSTQANGEDLICKLNVGWLTVWFEQERRNQ